MRKIFWALGRTSSSIQRNPQHNRHRQARVNMSQNPIMRLKWDIIFVFFSGYQQPSWQWQVPIKTVPGNLQKWAKQEPIRANNSKHQVQSSYGSSYKKLARGFWLFFWSTGLRAANQTLTVTPWWCSKSPYNLPRLALPVPSALWLCPPGRGIIRNKSVKRAYST